MLNSVSIFLKNVHEFNYHTTITLYFLMGFQHMPINIFLNVFTAFNHVHGFQSIRLEIHKHEIRSGFFKVPKPKYSDSFAEEKSLEFLDTTDLLLCQTQESQSTEPPFDYCVSELPSAGGLALGAWPLPPRGASPWCDKLTEVATSPQDSLSRQQRSSISGIWSMDRYIINCDWSAICRGLVPLWTIQDKFFTHLISLSMWHSKLMPVIEEYSMHEINRHITKLSVASKWMCYQEALQRDISLRVKTFLKCIWRNLSALRSYVLINRAPCQIIVVDTKPYPLEGHNIHQQM